MLWVEDGAINNLAVCVLVSKPYVAVCNSCCSALRHFIRPHAHEQIQSSLLCSVTLVLSLTAMRTVRYLGQSQD